MHFKVTHTAVFFYALVIKCLALNLLKPVPNKNFALQAVSLERTLLSLTDMDDIKRHAGLYRDKNAHPEFSNTVLVTAANVAYHDLLLNWQCNADRLGLDYMVVALDPKLKLKLKSDQSILVNGTFVPRSSWFRTDRFNVMASNKIKMVQEIIAYTGLNVVFSDPDNVFGRDPFAHDDDFGQKIRSNKYQYIYQQNHAYRPHDSDIGALVEEGNTGFYYVSGSQKQEGIQNLFLGTLEICKNDTHMDDQRNFWIALHNICNGTADYGPSGFECCNLCGQGPTCNASSDHVLDYCEMNPFLHATGWLDQPTPDNNISSYHANYIVDSGNKKTRLKQMGFWCNNFTNSSGNSSSLPTGTPLL